MAPDAEPQGRPGLGAPSASSRAKQQVGPLIALVMAGLAASLVLAELLVRLTGVAAVSITEPIYQRSAAPGVVYEFQPGIRGYTWGRTWVEANSLGLRGPEIAREKPPGVIRIGIFGDSATFGHGVREEDTYSRVLERNNPGLQVLNFGVPSYSITNIVSTFVEKGVPLNLDVAIIAPIVQDYGLHRAHTCDDYGYPVHAASPVKPGLLKNALRRLHLSYLVRDAWWALTGANTPELVALQDSGESDPIAKTTWTRGAGELSRFVAVARDHGIKPVYLAIGTPMPPTLQRIVAQSGFDMIIDMQPITASYSRDDLQVAPRDAHPSPLHHRLIAEALGKALGRGRGQTAPPS